MKPFIYTLGLFALLMLVSTSCEEAIDGQGAIYTTEISLPSFEEVEFDLPGKLFITKGSTQSVELVTNESLLNYVEISYADKRLYIQFEDGYYPRYFDVLELHITVPALNKLELKGSGDVFTMSTFYTDQFTAVVSGSGSMNLHSIHANSANYVVQGSGNLIMNNNNTNAVYSSVFGSGDVFLKGSTGNQEIMINGSGDVDAYDLYSRWANVTTNGSGTCKLLADDYLKVRINGSGDVYYKGNAEVDFRTNGSGNIRYIAY